MSIDVNVQNDLVIVTESSEDITVNVSNAAGPAGVGVPSGGSTGQVLKKLTNTDYDTYWAIDGGGVPYSGATGDVNLGEFQLRAGQVTLDTTPTGTASVATTRWNDTTGVSETTLKGGNVILKNGVDLVARVVNKVTPNTTLTKANYQAVRISGAQGQRLAVALAQANNDANSADTIGLVCETIATNQEGFIMTMGQLENINTTGSLQGETWVDGDVLYLSPTTAGAITKVKPTGGGHIVVIGYVEYAHVNNGKIYVKVMNGWELDELHNVDIVTPANNDALIYESSTALWKNKTIATALGYTPISGSGVTGQVAYWNGTNSQTGSNNLFWDAANSRLGIGTNAPAYRLHNVGTSAFDNGNSGDAVTILNSGYISMASTRFRGIASAFQFQDNAYNIRSQIAVTGGLTYFANGGGNVSIGSSADGGQRLQVYGDAFVRGSGATSATNALLVQNSAGTEIFRVYNDGVGVVRSALVTGTLTNCIQVFNNGGGVNPKKIEAYWGGGTPYGMQINTNLDTDTAVGNGYGLQIRNIGAIFTTGDYTNLVLNASYSPSSGNGTYTQLRISPTMNQGGGANGITRGLYVNPTLTAAADWRSIEWSNNSGWGLYGAGTANNYLAGRLGIGNTNPAQPLDLLFNNSSSAATGIVVKNSNSAGRASAAFYNNNNEGGVFSTYGSTFPTSSYINNFVVGATKAIIFLADSEIATGGSSRISWVTGGYNVAAAMTLTAAGRLLLGTTTEGTFLLDVNGTARVSGDMVVNSVNIGRGGSSVASNTACGVNSLIINTTGGNNSAFGSLSLSANTTGGNNSAFGRAALRFTTSGGDNSAFGVSALESNLTGTGNSAFGMFALLSQTAGTNTALGYYSLASNTTGSGNVATGHYSLLTNTTGSNNIALGQEAGRYVGVSTTANQTSSNSIYIGHQTRGLADNQTNQIVIGYQETGLGSNTTIIGNSSTTLTALRGSLISGGTSVNASAQVQIDSITKGFLPPRMTTTQKNSIGTPAAGLVVYDTDTNKLCCYNGTTWNDLF